MEELFEEAVSEINRADHLLYVTLKYTRTGDVIISLVDRLIAALEKCIEILLENKGVREIPPAPIPRIIMVKKLYIEDPEIQEAMELYTKFRKIKKNKGVATGEFRRTLKVTIEVPGEDEPLITDIDSMQGDYDKVKDFLRHIKEMISDD